MPATLLDTVWKRQDAIDAVLAEGTEALEQLRKAAPLLDSATAHKLAITLRLCGSNLQSVANSLDQTPKYKPR